MLAFLRWARSIALGMLNGVAKFALFIVLLIVVLFGIGFVEGDGLPGNMVLKLDLNSAIKDSSNPGVLALERTPTVMDIVLALDRAGHDGRVKGLFMRVGSAGLPVAQAEEIGSAIARFRKTGKFVIAHSQGFLSQGIGDYLTAASANEIWMQPRSPFGTAGEGSGAIFLRGLFDKIQAVPQIVKRADYKSAADTFMEKDYTAPDRVQTTAFLQSWYDSATQAVAADRKLDPKVVISVLQASPQFAEDAKRAHLIDKTGYDDEAQQAAKARGNDGNLVSLMDYARATEDASSVGKGPRVALITGTGDIIDGSVRHGGLFEDSNQIAGDDFAEAIRKATRDSSIKAILFRIDSPGGSVTASDQILDALKKARAAGKPVIVSMGTLAASGGYYVSCAANKIVAEPATLTGSIGVLTGKVAIGKSLGLIGVTEDQIGVGKNALFDSSVSPYTPDQWANLNAQADAIYADFLQKVASGRKLPLDTVKNIAKGRVWTGADARGRGLVDDLGGFWKAVADAKTAAGIAPDERVVFKRYPQSEGLFQALRDAAGGTEAGVRAMEGLSTLAEAPVAHAVLEAISEVPRGSIEMRAINLPVQ
ncbi:MAG TPA: signal peptide peptidase SppA [Rhizomicrobium sp.]